MATKIKTVKPNDYQAEVWKREAKRKNTDFDIQSKRASNEFGYTKQGYANQDASNNADWAARDKRASQQFGYTQQGYVNQDNANNADWALRGQQNNQNFGYAQQALTNAGWERDYQTGQLHNNEINQSLARNNARGSYTGDAIQAGMEPINQGYKVAEQQFGQARDTFNNTNTGLTNERNAYAADRALGMQQATDTLGNARTDITNARNAYNADRALGMRQATDNFNLENTGIANNRAAYGDMQWERTHGAVGGGGSGGTPRTDPAKPTSATAATGASSSPSLNTAVQTGVVPAQAAAMYTGTSYPRQTTTAPVKPTMPKKTYGKAANYGYYYG